MEPKQQQQQLEFGCFDNYQKLRAELLTVPASSFHAVVGYDDRCFACGMDNCRCRIIVKSALPVNGEAVDEAQQPALPMPPPVTMSSESSSASSPQKAKLPGASAGGWANLFRNSPAAQNAVVVPLTSAETSNAAAAPAAPTSSAWASRESVSPEKDLELPAISAHLRRVAAASLSASQQQQPPAPLQPRGLNNPGNYCYINAILQMLFLCPPFHAYFRALGQHCPSFRHRGPSSTPALDCLVELLSYYSLAANPRKFTSGQPYTPHQAYHLVANSLSRPAGSGTQLRAGREEDAEEFLSHLLNSLHDELARAIAGVSNGQAQSNGNEANEEHDKQQQPLQQQGEKSAEEDDEWQCVGPKNRSAVTRSCSELSSSTGTIVSELFGGQLRHQLLRPNRPPTANLQPFFVLPLDISTAESAQCTLTDALDAVTRSEFVETTQGRASKTQLFEQLPRLLLLQLKRFHYADSSGSVVKIDRRLDFPDILKLRKAWLSQQARAKPQCLEYRLFSIVYHVGHAASGHYITAVLQPGLNRWLMLDDASVDIFQTDRAHLAAPELPSVKNPDQVRRLHPYLLMYRRADCAGFE